MLRLSAAKATAAAVARTIVRRPMSSIVRGLTVRPLRRALTP